MEIWESKVLTHPCKDIQAHKLRMLINTQTLHCRFMALGVSWFASKKCKMAILELWPKKGGSKSIRRTELTSCCNHHPQSCPSLDQWLPSNPPLPCHAEALRCKYSAHTLGYLWIRRRQMLLLVTWHCYGYETFTVRNILYEVFCGIIVVASQGAVTSLLLHCRWVCRQAFVYIAHLL